MATQGALHGLRVLVTRPAGQADRLCALIEMAGGEAVCLPAIEILDPVDVSCLETVVDALASYDLAVFISVNAVTRGMAFISLRRKWPHGVKVATVGARSAVALARYGLTVDLVPSHHFNSEALLALDALQDMTGKRVVIFRGNGGRERLRDTLVARGAEVDYAEVYRRACPVVDQQSIAPYWQPGVLDAITITSNETLQNLFDMAGMEGQRRLVERPLVVVSQRQVVLADRLGFKCRPLVAENASDEAIVTALKKLPRANPNFSRD
jgi:uroporphyrinogen-III synthase